MKKHTYDVVIAGAGIIGSSVAWHLARKGMRVLLADAGPLGGEASSAGAGMLAPGGEVYEETDFATLLVKSLHRYPSFVAGLQDVSGIPIDFSVTGAIEKVPADDLANFHSRAAVQRRLGINCRQISSTEFFYPDDACVNPVDIVSALRVILARHENVVVREHAGVHEIQPMAEGVIVDGVPAHAAVIASGAWSTQIRVPGISLPAAYPVKGHLLGYQLPPHSIPTIVRGGHVYILQRSNGFTIVGSSQENAGFDKAIDPRIAAQIREAGEALLPMLEAYEPAKVWTGLRPGAASPLLHRVPRTKLWLAYGHFRNGILSAPETADRLAREIAAELISSSEMDSSARGSNL